MLGCLHVPENNFGSVENVIIRRQWELMRGLVQRLRFIPMFCTLSQFVATCRCERPLCGDTNTAAKAPRHTPQTLSKITESQSRRVCCTIRSIILFFPSLFCLWEQGVTSCISAVNYCIRLAVSRQKIQCLKVFLVLSLCYNRHFIQSWLRLKKASSGGLKHHCCVDCFINNGVWCMDTQGP